MTPRLSASSQLTHQITANDGGLPLHLLHVAAHLDCVGEVDVGSWHKRWADHATASMFVMRHEGVGIDFITQVPPSSIYKRNDSGETDIVADSIDMRELRHPAECVFLRTLGTGSYREAHLETGLVMARGNLFGKSDGTLWRDAFVGKFSSVQMSGTSVPATLNGAVASLF